MPSLSARSTLALALAAASLFYAVLLLGARNNHDRFIAFYYAPVVAPFIAFAAERAARWPGTRAPALAVDVAVLALALVRGIHYVPLLSGHALFLGYALGSARVADARVGA